MDLKMKSVDKKTYKPKEACVYSICHPYLYERDLSYLIWRLADNPFETYVGVTSNEIKKRWKDHKALRARDNQLTSRFIESFGYDFDECFRVIFEGTLDQCYRVEYHLRREPNLGLNKKVGGKLKHRKLNKRYLKMIEEASSWSS